MTVSKSHFPSNRLVFLTEKLGASHEDMKHLIVPLCMEALTT